MPVDLKSKTDRELDRLIKNHHDKGRTAAPLCQAALAERARRKAPGVDIRKSLEQLYIAARERRCLCYKDLADASGADWSKVRYLVTGQLGDIVALAKEKGLPMLSAIVVNKPDVESGRMRGGALEGFAAAARWLGLDYGSAGALQEEQREAVFDAAQRHPNFTFILSGTT